VLEICWVLWKYALANEACTLACNVVVLLLYLWWRGGGEEERNAVSHALLDPFHLSTQHTTHKVLHSELAS
jgi:hypothetical protein